MKSQVKNLVRVFIALVLLLPVLTLIFKVQNWSLPEWSEVGPALLSTFLQSFLSAAFTMVLGFMGALGVLSLKARRTFIEIVLLLPTFLPSLFVLLGCLQIISPFPFGIFGIVLVHTIIYSGLLAVMIARLLEARVGAFAELALVEGANSFLFLRKGVIPYLSKDLFSMFTYVFAMCVSSFSVPIVVGGRAVSTLEVLIYEKAMVESNTAQAIVLCFMQFGALFALSFISSQSTPAESTSHNLTLITKRLLYLPLFFISIGLVVVNLLGLSKGFFEISRLANFEFLFSKALQGTIFVSVSVVLCIFVFLIAIAYGFPHAKFERFLHSFVAPSTVLTGFAFMFLGSGSLSTQSELETFIKISLAFSILTLCSLYRLKWSSSLDKIKTQIQIANTLGASDIAVFKKIIIPQIMPDALMLSGMAGFWACGDFALSQLISGQSLTLSLVASGLLGAYRLESATLFVWLSLFIGVILFITLWSLSRVANKKLVS